MVITRKRVPQNETMCGRNSSPTDVTGHLCSTRSLLELASDASRDQQVNCCVTRRNRREGRLFNTLRSRMDRKQVFRLTRCSSYFRPDTYLSTPLITWLHTGRCPGHTIAAPSTSISTPRTLHSSKIDDSCDTGKDLRLVLFHTSQEQQNI